MGYMKRVVGWRLSGWPIAQPVQASVGLVPFRDPESYRERKLAEKEAAAERAAIQAEARECERLEAEARAEAERPVLGAEGWYRVDQTFYRIGSGPCPTFGPIAMRSKANACRSVERTGKEVQLGLFE